MKNPLNDIEAFAAINGGISIGLGLAAIGAHSPADSEYFLFGAIFNGLISILALIASVKSKSEKKSARLGPEADKCEEEKSCNDSRDIIITRIIGVVKENDHGEM